MYCPACGTELYRESVFCHKCGRRTLSLEPPTNATLQTQQQLLKPRNDKELVEALDQKTLRYDKCLVCLRVDNLVFVDFGLSRTKRGRKWNETIASVLISSISVPLGGFGLIRLPGKTSETIMFPMRFTVCKTCISEDMDYSLHPWFDLLWDYGFNQFVCPEEITFHQAQLNRVKV
jgi:hypothetical protein